MMVVQGSIHYQEGNVGSQVFTDEDMRNGNSTIIQVFATRNDGTDPSSIACMLQDVMREAGERAQRETSIYNGLYPVKIALSVRGT